MLIALAGRMANGLMPILLAKQWQKT